MVSEMMTNDSYMSRMALGEMVREAAKAATFDELIQPDLKRINDIQVCETFLNALVDKGCMITGIPNHA
jgi:hypothetical protein